MRVRWCVLWSRLMHVNLKAPFVLFAVSHQKGNGPMLRAKQSCMVLCCWYFFAYDTKWFSLFPSCTCTRTKQKVGWEGRDKTQNNNNKTENNNLVYIPLCIFRKKKKIPGSNDFAFEGPLGPLELREGLIWILYLGEGHCHRTKRKIECHWGHWGHGHVPQK